MKFKYYLSLLLSLLTAITASAISGDYDDPGGGTYWSNVYVASVSNGQSYKWCTGKDEATAMDNFRGFESENNGSLSIVNPNIKVKFRFHYSQGNGFERDGSRQEIYVMLRDGSLSKIGEWPRGGDSKFTQTDQTYGILGDLDEPTALTIATSGVNDLAADSDGILISPTLVRDVVNVRAGSLLESVTVYSTGGAQVARVSRIGDNAAQVDLSRLDAGVYFVEAVTATGNRVVKRIVKQ